MGRTWQRTTCPRGSYEITESGYVRRVVWNREVFCSSREYARLLSSLSSVDVFDPFTVVVVNSSNRWN